MGRRRRKRAALRPGWIAGLAAAAAALMLLVAGLERLGLALALVLG